MLCASVSCWARLFLQHLRHRYFWIICETDIDGSPASHKISLTVQWLWGLSSWLRNSDSTVSMFSSVLVCALRLPLPGRLSTVPNFNSSLWILFFVQPLSKNSVNLYIDTDFWSKFCLLYWTASKLAHLLDTASKLALFSMSDFSDLKDEELTKKQTYMKTETCNVYSRDFWIFLPNIVKISLSP